MRSLELVRVEIDGGLVEGIIDTQDLSVKAITTYQRQFYPDTDPSLPLWMDEYAFVHSRLVFVLDPYDSLEEVNQSSELSSDFRRAAINILLDHPELSTTLSEQQAAEILAVVSFRPRSIFADKEERFRKSVVTAS